MITIPSLRPSIYIERAILRVHQRYRVERSGAEVSMLSVPSIFFRPKDRAEEADAAREKSASLEVSLEFQTS